MIIDERTATFIDLLDPGHNDFLNRLEEDALSRDVPIVRKSMGSLLKFLVEYRKPRAILEIGTAVGFSALLMSEYAGADCHITTIEKYEKRIPLAKQNFAEAFAEKTCGMQYAATSWEDRITFLPGDAFEILPTLHRQYDIIFMDAAKGQYIHWLPELMRLLPEGGLLISDNVLQDGDVIESRFAVCRRDRTIHSRMREYLYTLKHHPELSTVILPVGDGVTLSTKITAEKSEI